MGDTRQATWSRTYARVMANADELRQLGCVVLTPANFHVAPVFRSRITPAIVEVSRTGVEPTEDSAPDRPGGE